jgi:hypothetical protein
MSSETEAPRERPVRGPERLRRESPGATVALMALLAGLACGGRSSAASGVLPESTYVQVMARLSLTDSALAPAEYTPPADLSRDSARALVLRRWGVADSALLSYAARLGDDPGRLKDVWNRVRTLADSLARAGWTPAAAEAR